MKHIASLLILLSFVTTVTAQSLKQWRDSLDRVNKDLQLLEWKDAIDACGQVLEKDGNNLAALYYRAYANNNLRRYDLAKNDYEKFLSLSPDNAAARLGLAYTYIKLERPNDALDQLNNLIEIHPDYAVAYATRAELEKDLKMYDTALFDFDEALKRDPGNKDYTVSKVEILILQGRREDAKNALDTAVSHGVPRGLLLEWYAKCK